MALMIEGENSEKDCAQVLSGSLSIKFIGLMLTDDLLSKEEPEGAEYYWQCSQALDNMAKCSPRMFSRSGRVDPHSIHCDLFLRFC